MANTEKWALDMDLNSNLAEPRDEGNSTQTKLDRLQTGAIKTLHRISQAKISSKLWLMALMAVDALQLMFFPLGSQAALPWLRSAIMSSGIYVPFLYLVFIPGAAMAETLHRMFTAQWLFVAAAMWAALMLTSMGLCILSEAGFTTLDTTWLYRLTVLMTHISLYALSVPLISSLMAPWVGQEGQVWIDTGITVHSGPHVAMIIIGTVLLIALLVQLGVVAWVCVDRYPFNPVARKRNLLAAAHGRVGLVVLLLKVALVCLWIFGGISNSISGYAYIIIVAAVAAAYFAAYYIFMPCYESVLNEFHCALASAMFAACIAGIIGLSHSDRDSAILILIVLAPVSAYGGKAALETRQKRLAELLRHHSETTLGSSPYTVELAVRTLLMDALETQMHSGGSEGGAVDKANKNGMNGLTIIDTDDGKCQFIVPPVRQEQQNELISKSHPTVRRIFDLLHTARAALPGSGSLDATIANFAKYAMRNRHLERIYLRAAQSKAEKSALDVHTFVQFRLREMELEEEIAAAGKMSVTKRMEFERLLEYSSQLMLRGQSQLVQFWTALQDKSPDVSMLTRLGEAITATAHDGHAIFSQLLVMAPQSIMVMRAYAEFLLRLGNDPRKASELLTDAEQAEDEQSRTRQQSAEVADVLLGMMMPEFDLSIDNTSIVRVSAQVGSMGIITDANAAALKMVGYTKREVAGRDVNVLVPEPIARVHPMLLENFTRDGKEVIINTSRIYFVQHRTGYVFPARVHVRPLVDEWAAIMDEVVTPQAFIWFTGASTNWKVTAVCKSSLTALSLDLQAIRNGAVAMTDLAPNLPAALAMLESGATIKMQLQSMERHLGNHVPTFVGVSAKLQKMRLPSLDDTLYILRYIPISKLSSAQGSSHKSFSFGSKRAVDVTAQATNVSLELPTVIESPSKSSHYDGDIQLCPVMSSRSQSNRQVDRGAAGVQVTAQVSTCRERTQESTTPTTDMLTTQLTSPPAANVLSPNGKPRAVGFIEDDANSIDSMEGAGRSPISDGEGGDSLDSPPVKAAHGGARFLGNGTVSPFVEKAGKPQGRLSPEVAAASKGPRRSILDPNAGEMHVAPGSVHSKGSGASSTSMSEILRKGVSAKNSQFDPSLKRLKWAIKVIFATVCLLSIVSVIMDNILFGQLIQNMELVALNGDRGRYLQASYAAALRMTLAVEGKFNLSREGYNGTDARMKKNLDRFEEIHHKLYLDVDGALQKEVDLYTKDNVLIEDLIPGTYISRGNFSSKMRYVNLANAGLEYLGKARQYLDIPPAERVMTHPIVFWITHNGWRGIRDQMNYSIMISSDRSSTQADTIETANVSILGIVFGLLALMGLSVMVPAISYVSSSTQKVYNIFLQVPLPIVKALRQESLVTLQNLRRAEEGVDNEADGENFQGEELDYGTEGKIPQELEPGHVLKMALNTYQNKARQFKQGVGTLDHDSADEAHGAVIVHAPSNEAVAPLHAPKKQSSTTCCARNAHTGGRTFKNASSNTSRMLIVMFWPVLFVLAYFLGTYFWKHNVTGNARYAKSEILWSKQVQFYIPQALFGPRMATGYCDYEFSNYAIIRARRAIAFMDYLQDGLLYGNENKLMRPSLQHNKEIADLFLKNACVENEGAFYTMDECQNTFMQGLLSKVGLRAAMTEYLQLVKQLLVERDAELLSPNCSYHPLNSGPGGSISDLGDWFLAPGFQKASDILYSQGMNDLRSFLSLDITLTILLIISLIFLYWAFYMGTITQLDSRIKRSRELLLVFPDEVSRAIPAIMQAGRDMLNSAGNMHANGK